MQTEIYTKQMRKTMLVLLFMGWALGNLDRYLVNYAVVYMGEDLSLTATQTGLVLSSFFLGYAIMQMPGGLLADKFGAKRVLLIAVIIWSIFTGLTAIAWSLASIVIIRFLFGIGEGGFQPAASKIIATVFPENERSKAMSIILASGAIMGILVPMLSALLLTTVGWRPIFVVCGLFGIIIAILYWKFIKLPTEEVVVTEDGQTKNKGILKQLVSMPFMWSLIISYFTIYAVNWGLSSWMPKYLTDVRGLDLMSIGYLQMIPGVIMLVSMLVFGAVIDKLTLTQNKVLGAVSALLIAIFLFLMFNATSISAFIIYQSLVSAVMTYIMLLLPSFVLKCIPKEVTGTAMGMANTGGQLAGFVTPTLMGFMVDLLDGSYNGAFWLLIVLAMVCIISIYSISIKHIHSNHLVTTSLKTEN